MPKFFCDYCDVYLTHDSMSVRKAHNSGRNHLRNVVDYYQQIGHEKAQSVIDSITSSYAAEGQAHANPMLPQNQPGQGFAPPPFPGFPGSAPPPGEQDRELIDDVAPGGAPPPFPGIPGGPPGQFPPVMPRMFPAAVGGKPDPLTAYQALPGAAPGRGMPPVPPFPLGPNGSNGMPPVAPPGGLPFSPPPGGFPPFPPPPGPNGAPGFPGAPPPNFPGMPNMPHSGQGFPPPHAMGAPPSSFQPGNPPGPGQDRR